jgi:hypothetical protein
VETIAASAFTDGGAAIGTYDMAGTIPAGAIILGTKVLIPAGMIGDVSCIMTIGDGSDVDRYQTGNLNVYTTAATGIQPGVPSGLLYQVAAVHPKLTITSAANITDTIAGGGSVTVGVYFIETV